MKLAHVEDGVGPKTSLIELKRISPSLSVSSSWTTHLAVNHGTNRLAVVELGNDTVHEGQVIRGRSGGTEVEVLITAARGPLVHEAVVDNGVRCVLDLDREALGDVVGGRSGGEDACHRGSGGGGCRGQGLSKAHSVGSGE